MMTLLNQICWVMLGGALGSAARFLTYEVFRQWMGSAKFPMGMLTVNVAGSFLIALIAALALKPSVFSDNTRLFLTVGVMGGLTTYSAFNQDLIEAFIGGKYWMAGLTLAVTVCACLAAGFLGLLAARGLIR